MEATQKNGSPRAEFEFDEDHSYFMARLPIHPAAREVAESQAAPESRLESGPESGLESTRSPTQSGSESRSEWRERPEWRLYGTFHSVSEKHLNATLLNWTFDGIIAVQWDTLILGVPMQCWWVSLARG